MCKWRNCLQQKVLQTIRTGEQLTASFRVYIDESGDEGFKFRHADDVQGSSHWFVLAAFITRKKTDLETVKTIDKVR